MREDLIRLLVMKEAISSIAIDNDSDIITVSEGITNNQKLYKIKVKVCNKHTNQIIWKGSIADVYRAFIGRKR